MTVSFRPALTLLVCLAVTETLSSEPLTYTINTKKWSHVLDDHFISVTINPTDLLQGKAFGLGMNSTLAILKGLSPAYIRVGSADTGKYTFKRSRYPSDIARTEDEFIITESHWTVFNDVVRSAGLDVIVCLNAAHRNGGNRKWDTRNSLELISFSDSQGYNLTFQLGYEVHRSSGFSGHQYGKDLNRLRTILNAFPRYQHSKLIGPDIRVLNKKEDAEFVNDVLLEAGSVLDAITWHPRWPQPSKMKVSDISELGYEFPTDYIEWDRNHLGKILQRSILKNPIWIGEPKTESTGTFAEGLLWARRLVLAAKLGIEVVMKQPSLMDISHPKPEYWIAFLHKRLLGKAVLETRAMNNHTEIAAITHCTNTLFWSDRPNKALDGAVTIYAVNMGGKEQKVYLKGSWGGKSQIMLQYLLTSGSDPDSVFSQMTYLNGEPLMMTDDGNLPDIVPRIRRIERGVLLKLPPYSVGFWVVPEAKVKVCQGQPAPATAPNFENVPVSNPMRNDQKSIPNARALNQLIVDKLKNPVSDSDEEFYDDGILSDDSSERDLIRESLESPGTRTSRRVREITVEDIGQELKDKIREIREMLENKGSEIERNTDPSEVLRNAEEKITSLTEELGAATRLTNQHEEFDRFLHKSGLNQDFGALMMNERKGLQGIRRSIQEKSPWGTVPRIHSVGFDPIAAKNRRFRRSLSYPEDDYEEESAESYSFEEEGDTEIRPNRKINYRKRLSRLHEDSDESGDHSGYSGSPALKSLEDKYKSFITYRIQDGKKKLNEIRRQKNKTESEEPKKPGTSLGNDLQEEILMKEVEVLEKTEEAMANLIKNHKKRAQTIEEIILHEISDIKEDRLTALEDMRNHKEVTQGVSEEVESTQEEKEISPKVRRNVLNALNKSSDIKTKRSIDVDSNLNGLPERSHEEKKSKIVKRSSDSSFERSYRRRKSRRASRDEDNSNEKSSRRLRKSRSERLERMKNFIQSRERIRDRNVFRKKLNRHQYKHRPDISEEESNESPRYGSNLFDKSEDMVIKEIQKEILKKPERTEMKQDEPAKFTAEAVKSTKKEDKRTENDNNRGNNNRGDNNNDNYDKKENENKKVSSQNNADEKKSKTEEKKQGSNQELKITIKKVKADEEPEYIPLKIDKNRGLNVLKRISNLVESMNTREKSKSRKPSMDVEDLSEEFYGDALSRLTKKRHRRSHHRDGEEADDAETNEESPKDAKTLRKEMKLRKILDRMNKRRKSDENDSDQGKSRLRARLEAKLAKLSAMEPSTEMTETPEEVKSTDNIVEMTTETPEEAIVGEEKEEKVEQSTTTEINVKADDKPEENKEEVAAQPENVTEIDPKVEQQKPDAEEKKPDIAVSSDLKKAPEVATEAPAAVETTLAATTEKSPEKKKEKVPADESLEMPQTILLIPEVEGLMYNPVIVAHAMENGEGLREEDYDGDMPTQVTNLEPFLREETSVPESVELARYSQPELPDLITELLEGQTMPWKGARAEEMEPSNGKRGSKSNEGNRAEKIVRMQEPEEREDKSELVGSYPGGSGSFVGSKSNEGSRAQKIVRMQEPEDKSELVGSYPGGSGSFVGSKSNEGNRAQKIVRMQEPEDKSELVGSYPGGSGSFVGSFASVSDVHTSRIPEGKRGEEIRDSGMDSDPNSSVAGLMKAELEDELPERESLETEMPATLSRKRRGIFDRGMLTPEERIRNFKRIVHRRHSPFGHRNELPVPENGESFWKMAGSTVKAVFNDVIPEAYGKTKNKIENLGIAEYFKEFGKIVEQMKNLDKLFANIGQAAVRNYIKGTEDEKGDYIQVIEKRRRSRRDVEGVLTTEMEQPTETTTAIPEQTTASNNVQTTVDLAENKPKPKGLKKSPKERPNDLIRDIFLLDSNPGIVEVTKTPLTTEAPQTISLQPFESRYAKMPKMNHIQSRFYKRESLKNQPLSEAEIQSMGISKFAPWMKTTKDFISQALTTLQRQRELSEMIARESVNDLVKREIERKVIGKREASVGGARFPVYQMPNRKREVYGNADDANSKFLNQLQPGVYIVPTEEMKNLRSEQITKEAPATKPGMPNMVTLNIYYDKKKPEEWSSSREADTTNVNEYVSYYNTPDAVWSPVPIANPTGEFVPPLPETTIGNGYLPPVPQHMPPFHTETRFHDPVHQRVLHYPEPYPDWVPAHGYPPRTQTFYYPEHQPYGPPKSDWADFKMHHVPTNREAESDSGWAVQFHPTKKPAKAQTRPTLRPPRTFPDKKRSIGKGKMDSNFPGLALPFWKFFTPKKDEKLQPTTAKPIDDVSSESESESIEELFAENRKRAKLNEAKNKDKKPEVTEAPAEEPQPEGSSRKRRDVVTVEFQDHDLIPEWFGTIQELDNTLHDQHDELERLARIVPLSLYDYEDDHSFLGEDILHRRRRDADDGKPVVKSLKSEDSSLEVQEHKPEEKPGKTEQPKSDDVISQFFKYAYESLVEMMKGMTGFI